MSRNRLPKGKGWFIWQIMETMNGDPQAIARFAKDNGFGHILLHVHNGWQDETRVDGGAELEPFIRAADELGIECWGWGAVYASNWSTCADMIIKALDKHPKLVGHVVDAEAGMKYSPVEAESMMKKVRTAFPDLPIGLSSYRFPESHPELPWKQFRAYCDFDMPQVYWEQDFRDEAGELQLQSSYYQFQNLTPTLPYLPTGPAYKVGEWKTTAEQVRRFFLKAKAMGFHGCNFWVWFQTQRDLPEVFELIRVNQVFTENEDPDIPEPVDPEIPVDLEDYIQLKVISRVRVRTLPNTSLFSREIRKREAGEIVNALDLHVNNKRSVWVKDKEGWSAIVHGDYQYMVAHDSL